MLNAEDLQGTSLDDPAVYKRLQRNDRARRGPAGSRSTSAACTANGIQTALPAADIHSSKRSSA